MATTTARSGRRRSAAAGRPSPPTSTQTSDRHRYVPKACTAAIASRTNRAGPPVKGIDYEFDGLAGLRPSRPTDVHRHRCLNGCTGARTDDDPPGEQLRGPGRNYADPLAGVASRRADADQVSPRCAIWVATTRTGTGPSTSTTAPARSPRRSRSVSSRPATTRTRSSSTAHRPTGASARARARSPTAQGTARPAPRRPLPTPSRTQ